MTAPTKKNRSTATTTATATPPQVAAPAPTASASPTPTQRQPQDRQAVIGIQRNLASVGSITLVGKDYTPAALVAVFQNRVDAADTTDESERTWHDDVASERELEATVAPVRKAFRAFLVSRYGAMSKKLAEFGVTPPTKRRKPASKTLAEAAEKSGATRVARGTMGKRARLKVTGAPAPAPSPEVPTAAASPATPTANVTPPATNGTTSTNGTPSK